MAWVVQGPGMLVSDPLPILYHLLNKLLAFLRFEDPLPVFNFNIAAAWSCDFHFHMAKKNISGYRKKH